MTRVNLIDIQVTFNIEFQVNKQLFFKWITNTIITTALSW